MIQLTEEDKKKLEALKKKLPADKLAEFYKEKSESGNLVPQDHVETKSYEEEGWP